MRINRKAEMGIGTLILFIAFILVAAVAASVLVSTTGALQSKALVTGKATQAEVGTSMTAIEVYSEDATSDYQVDYFYETIKLSSGSDPIRFSDILLTMNTNNASGEYSYQSNHTLDNCSDGDGSTLGLTTYGIEYSLTSDDYTDGYIFPGDVVKLCWKSPRGINEAEAIKISLVPKVGATLAVETDMPALMKDTRAYVFP